MSKRNSKNSIEKTKSQIKVAMALLCIIIIITCFVVGTAVLMASGMSKAIENIRVGDMAKSYNSVTGKVSNKRVLQTFENETDELVRVSTSDGQEIVSTPGHKFYANNQWLSAEDLRAGDVLV